MQPLVIDVKEAEDWRDVVHRAVQVLAEGGLVVFPTETVYGLAASALDEAAVARMEKVKSRKGSKLSMNFATTSIFAKTSPSSATRSARQFTRSG
jgi:tRNA A37 threonylcarbamoyladenosine synthetase subunit TsaC/SUA5/YrdC